MGEIISEIAISGYKSIRELPPFQLGNINVLIGPNGVGKSNFVSIFRLLDDLIHQKFQLAISQEGGADACLYLGPKITRELNVKLMFQEYGYKFSLIPTVDNRLVFSSEEAMRNSHIFAQDEWYDSFGSGHLEAKLKTHKDASGIRTESGVPHYILEALSNLVVYHFHDTSIYANVRRQGAINDNISLRANADNLAAFLYRLGSTHPADYAKIRDAIRLAAPFFDDFQLRPVPFNPEKIQLEWRQRGSDYPLLASQLSDGTLRFICLATALLQPDAPRTMLFDEPELGLHPYALSLLGAMIHKSVAPFGTPSNQIIVSTQSALLLNEFTPEDIIVVQREGDQSTFKRLNAEELSGWLADYTSASSGRKTSLAADRSLTRLTRFPATDKPRDDPGAHHLRRTD